MFLCVMEYSFSNTQHLCAFPGKITLPTIHLELTYKNSVYKLVYVSQSNYCNIKTQVEYKVIMIISLLKVKKVIYVFIKVYKKRYVELNCYKRSVAKLFSNIYSEVGLNIYIMLTSNLFVECVFHELQT